MVMIGDEREREAEIIGDEGVNLARGNAAWVVSI